MEGSGVDMKVTLKEALNAMYQSPEEEVRANANRWLQEFQRKVEAWQVSDSLLHDPSSSIETLIFCSQTLKSKVLRDFEELPPEAFVPLRESLKNLMKKFCKGPSKVQTQISIAIAGLAVHVSGQQWGDGGFLNWVKNEFTTSPEYLPCLLEVLTVVPQEAYSYRIAARPERRRQFLKELTSSVELAFNILSSCLAVPDLYELVLDAFASWLRLSDDIPATTLASHTLVQASLSAFNVDKLFEAAVNAVCELIRYSVSGSFEKQMPLIQVLVPHVMGLRPRFAASLKNAKTQNNTEDEEIVKGMARLFAEMGDAYAEMIATGSSESMMIVEVLLEVTSHGDYDISSMTYNFWHSLQLFITRREYCDEATYPTDAAKDAEVQRRISIFRPVFQVLVSLVSYRLTYPDDFNEWATEDATEFKRTRYAIADMLTDAAIVLGAENILKLLSDSFFQNASTASNDASWDWRTTEGSLQCIRAIARHVPASETVIMPQVLMMMAKLPLHVPQLLHTACITTGAFAKWLGKSPASQSLIPSIVDIVIKGMTGGRGITPAASLALRNICEACKDKLGGSINGLFDIYHKATSGQTEYKLSNNDALQIIEALSMIITPLPKEQAMSAIESLCMPSFSSLQQVIAQQSQSAERLPADQYSVHIDRLANIFRFVRHPEAVVAVFQKLWPLLKMLFSQRGWDMPTMERLCRACKYAIRTCQTSIAVVMGDILQEVQMQYKVHNQSCFLYLASEVVKVFGSDSAYVNYLGSLIAEMFGHTMSLLRTIQEFTSRPDIADDCFLMASRCVRYCPTLLIHSNVFAPLVDCAMTGITIQHREACMSIMSYLSDLFELILTENGNQYRPAIDGVMMLRGSNLVRLLLACLVGAIPESRIEDVVCVLLPMTKAYGAHALNWAQEAVSLIPASVINDEERSKFLQLFSAMVSGQYNEDLAFVMEDLSDICRRNKAIQDQVQAALQPLKIMM